MRETIAELAPTMQGTVRASGAGGLASFLGIACPTCNKVLMLVFGGPALLAWFDPLRPLLAAAGLVIMGIAALATWRRFRDVRAGNGEVPDSQDERAKHASI